MLSAVEALVKIRTPDGKHRKDWDKLEQILGPELKKDLWGTKDDHSTALRHRLMHGEYFQPKDGVTNYVDRLHKQVIEYLNDSVLKKQLLDDGIEFPQRHPLGIKKQDGYWIRALTTAPITLLDILTDMEENSDNLSRYEIIVDGELWESY